MKVIVEVEWTKPDDVEFFNVGSIGTALANHFPDSEFHIKSLKLADLQYTVNKVTEEIYQDEYFNKFCVNDDCMLNIEGGK